LVRALACPTLRPGFPAIGALPLQLLHRAPQLADDQKRRNATETDNYHFHNVLLTDVVFVYAVGLFRA